MGSTHLVRAVAALLAPFLVATAWAQQALQGPFRPGTGSWSVVKDGGFEVAPGTLPTRYAYVLDGAWFLMTSLGTSGSASIAPVAAARGNHGVVIRPGGFSGAGVALTLGSLFQLPAGVPHVLSAWVRRPNPANGAAKMYLDLSDTPGDIAVPIPAKPGWLFVHGTFTPTSSAVGIRAVIDGQVTTLDELHVDELAITPLATFRPPEPQLELFNVRFGTKDSAPIRGPAAYGESTNDFWNHYSRDDVSGLFKQSGTLSPLLDASGKPTEAGLFIDNAPGAWGTGLPHPLLAVYLYPLDGGPRITITVTNLPTGSYDAYLYGHGGPPDSFNTAFTVQSGHIDYGSRSTTTNASWRLPEWTEGSQYVRFTNVFVSGSHPLHVFADKDAQYHASLNGLQLVRRSSERFHVTPDSTAFRGAIEVLALHDKSLLLRFTTNDAIPTTQSPLLGPVLLLTNSTRMTVQAFEAGQPVGDVVRRDFTLLPAPEDGIAVEWRLKYFGAQAWNDPRSHATADPDADGSTNLQEFLAGTSPLDPLEGFTSSVRQVPSVQWNSVEGVTYRILKKDRLSDPEWIEVRRVRAGGSRTEYTDPTVQGEPRFFRIEAIR